MKFEEKHVASALLDCSTNTYTRFEKISIRQTIEETIPGSKLITQPCTSCSVIWCHHAYTLIPDHLFDERIAGTYLNTNVRSDNETALYHDTIPSIGMVNIYTVPEEIVQSMYKYHPSMLLRHHMTILISALINKYKEEKGEQVYLNIQTGTFDLIVIKQAQLIFCNTFHYKIAEDLFYYTAYTLDTLGLNMREIKPTLLYDVEVNQKLIDLFNTYTGSVHIEKLPDHAQYEMDIKNNRCNFTLFSQYQFI